MSSVRMCKSHDFCLSIFFFLIEGGQEGERTRLTEFSKIHFDKIICTEHEFGDR